MVAEPHRDEPVMERGATRVGLDVHKQSIAISARARGGTAGKADDLQ